MTMTLLEKTQSTYGFQAVVQVINGELYVIAGNGGQRWRIAEVKDNQTLSH